MPLIDVTLRPHFQLSKIDGDWIEALESRQFVRKVLGPKLPGLFVAESKWLGMESDTPESGVQVQFHDYDEDDINVADLWIKVQFSEEQSSRLRRTEIRDAVFGIVVAAMHDLDVKMPNNFILDVLWGPTHGSGSVNGVFIEW